MNYAKYILVHTMASVAKEIKMLETEGKTELHKVPDFLKYNNDELEKVISDLNMKYVDLVAALKLLNKFFP